ncbi:hypothetical protein BGW38_002113 [Lunasporangiospora selenospora]|uniref:Transcription initiation factor TFIID subunit 13 n=1 Tax=Lunasporangiospora selenospora TaxID=979761 RepID=A0A9P6KDT2_9FUNG|nr:hypothetical protein BGW38_002113 [Lunasporangiospora selenospora]
MSSTGPVTQQQGAASAPAATSQSSSPAPTLRKPGSAPLGRPPVKQLMYGFGDVPNPSNDAVGVLEEMLIEYLTDACLQAAVVSDKRGKVSVEDFKFVLRKDAKKRSRVDELLYMNEDIRRAKKIADIPELDNNKGGSKDASL